MLKLGSFPSPSCSFVTVKEAKTTGQIASWCKSPQLHYCQRSFTDLHQMRIRPCLLKTPYKIYKTPDKSGTYGKRLKFWNPLSASIFVWIPLSVCYTVWSIHAYSGQILSLLPFVFLTSLPSRARNQFLFSPQHIAVLLLWNRKWSVRANTYLVFRACIWLPVISEWAESYLSDQIIHLELYFNAINTVDYVQWNHQKTLALGPEWLQK